MNPQISVRAGESARTGAILTRTNVPPGNRWVGICTPILSARNSSTIGARRFSRLSESGCALAGVIPITKRFSMLYRKCGGRFRQYSAITPQDACFPVICVSPFPCESLFFLLTSNLHLEHLEFVEVQSKYKIVRAAVPSINTSPTRTIMYVTSLRIQIVILLLMCLVQSIVNDFSREERGKHRLNSLRCDQASGDLLPFAI